MKTKDYQTKDYQNKIIISVLCMVITVLLTMLTRLFNDEAWIIFLLLLIIQCIVFLTMVFVLDLIKNVKVIRNAKHKNEK
jgi:4-hydroxybenzoate polyprenyltransferase